MVRSDSERSARFTNSVTIFGNPAVVGLAANTVYQYEISTVNNAFGCNDPATQVSKTGSITITPQPSINLTSGSADLTICSGETVSSTLGGVDIEYDITGYALGATVSATSLPTGINTSYTAIPQITEISFAGNVANIDDNDNPIKEANTQKTVCALAADILLIPKLI